jgi:sec-independent protein translocase protein TatA
MMPFKLGPLEIILILVIILVIFGVGKLPQVGSALGKTMKAFKTGQADDDEEEVEARPKRRRKTAKRSASV